jgi:hypothetical protein
MSGEFTDQVRANVSQYDILQKTNNALSGSQIPLLPASSSLALDARSIGTRRMIEAGSPSAKNIGTRR